MTHTLTPYGPDYRLVVHDKRGHLLAQALGGRLARRPRAWFLTPGRAEKWRALYDAGYSARKCMIHGITGWGFVRDRRAVSLAEAVKSTCTL